jgi:hypothetical protein
VDVVLPDDTELDKLFIQTFAAEKDEEKKLRALYGPVLTVMYNAIKSNNSRRLPERGKDFCLSRVCNILARRNMSGKVWGNQTGPRAELLAALPSKLPRYSDPSKSPLDLTMLFVE